MLSSSTYFQIHGPTENGWIQKSLGSIKFDWVAKPGSAPEEERPRKRPKNKIFDRFNFGKKDNHFNLLRSNVE